MIHFTIPDSVLKSAALFTMTAHEGARDGRGSYLQQVCITSIDGTIYVVGTNGNSLACFSDFRQTLPDFEILLPVVVIKAVRSTKATAHADWTFHVEPAVRDPKTKRVTQPAEITIDLPNGNLDMIVASTDKYPDFQRVIPESNPTSGSHAVFDHRQLNKFVEVQKILEVPDKRLGVLDYRHQGFNSTRVDILVEPPKGWGFIGVIVPFKLGGTTGY